MTSTASRLSGPPLLVLLILFAATSAAAAYTCDSIMGNVECGHGNNRKDLHVDKSARKDSSILGHHTHRHREYPWCSVGTGGHHSHCGYTSLKQCRQTVRGAGVLCNRNPAYRP
jgi:hypothetical protein